MTPAVKMLDPLEAILGGPHPSTLRIGLAVPLSGLLGMTGPSALEAALLAGSEINFRGGGGRPVEFVVVNSGRDANLVASEISQLAEMGTVDAFVGLHTSKTLERVEAQIGGRLPYVFASGYEDTHRVDGIFCPGETPGQFAPGLQMLMKDRQLERWAIIGTDYVWPRAARLVQNEAIDSARGTVVLDRIVPEGCPRGALAASIDGLVASGAQGVLLNMAGRDLVTTLEALRQRGLDRKVVRVAGGCLEENALYALGGDESGNLYSSMQSFESSPDAQRIDLNERYRRSAGERAPALNAWAERCYDGVHLIAHIAEQEKLNVDAFSSGTRSDSALWQSHTQHLALAEGLRFAAHASATP